MAIITVKNPELYKAWIEYYERTSSMKAYEVNTYAFFNSQRGESVPCN